MNTKIIFLILFFFPFSFIHLQAAEESGTIELLHDAFVLEEPLVIQREPIIATGILSLFYQSRNFEPAWSDLDYAKSIVALLGSSDQEGLYPKDYHYNALTDLLKQLQVKGPQHARKLAEMDVLLTDGLLLYAAHLVNGKISPARFEKTWNYNKVELLDEEIVLALNTHVDNRTITSALEKLKPNLPVYRQLRQGLSFFSELAAKEELEEIPTDKALKIGMKDTVVAQLRKRLQVLGFPVGNIHTALFDDQLEKSVQRFQQRYGLEADGIVGQATFNELNVPFSYRADQIRINMDRIRWVVNDISPEFILVNIAGYRLWLGKNNEVTWSTDVMTGTISNQTPIFKSTMTYLVLNPTWTAPRSITREMFPRFSQDPSYLARNNYQLMSAGGKRVDPESLNWDTLTQRSFPYTLVQMPGENNALGRVKFMFPNQHAIYLHDTPHKSLFVKAQRAFSHGCIRVKDPLKLAELLLKDQASWDRSKINATVNSGKLTNISLKKPIDVFLMYWTVQPDAEGRLGFVPDIYGRDLALIAALKKPVTQSL